MLEQVFLVADWPDALHGANPPLVASYDTRTRRGNGDPILGPGHRAHYHTLSIFAKSNAPKLTDLHYNLK